MLVEPGEQERRDVLAAHACVVGRGQAGREHAVVELAVEFVLDRVGQDEAVPVRPEPVLRAQHVRHLARALDPPGQAEARVAQVEAGEAVGAVADHADREGLEAFEGRADVEDRLHAGADDEHAGARERCEVGRLVPGQVRAAVHAAEPAGGEHPDAGAGGEVGGRGDGGGAHAPAGRDARELAHARLDGVGVARQSLQRRVVQTDVRRTVDDRDRSGHGPTVADRLLDVASDAQVVGAGEPVADDRALEGDDRAPGRERVSDLGVERHGASFRSDPREQ